MKNTKPEDSLPGFSLPDLLPVRMLNEFTYCPRLGYLMWVQGEFEDNVFTEDGRHVHRHVDERPGALPEPGVLEPPKVARSVMLSSERLGLVARMDLMEVIGDLAVPVEYKRGKRPELPEGAWEPERVQVCAQGLLLREHGFRCESGVIWFAGSKRRTEVLLDAPLIQRTLDLLKSFRKAASEGLPPPLEDSPKCAGCSLVGICLPDETLFLSNGPNGQGEPRRLTPARDDALPLYVQEQGARVGKKGDRLIVEHGGKILAEARLYETSRLMVFGNVQITTQAMRELMNRGISVVYASTGGWVYGMVPAGSQKNVELRMAQYRAALNPARALELSRRFVKAKILNGRTLLRRNARPRPVKVLSSLKR
ncbi:MAG: CRISPR-associated protein Cas4, partial [Pseudomonadota bacterium]